MVFNLNLNFSKTICKFGKCLIGVVANKSDIDKFLESGEVEEEEEGAAETDDDEARIIMMS